MELLCIINGREILKMASNERMYVDPQNFVIMLNGIYDLCYGLRRTVFNSTVEGIKKEKNGLFEFMDNNYDILKGTIELIEGVTNMITDGFANGDIDIVHML